jgi:hypothetical protein
MVIRKPDGTVKAVDDGYVLQSGESTTVPINLMDGGSDAEAALDEAHRQYRADIGERWRSNRWQSESSKGQPAERKAQPATSQPANPEAALAEAYAQYEADVQQRWRWR